MKNLNQFLMANMNMYKSAFPSKQKIMLFGFKSTYEICKGNFSLH